MPRSPIWPIDPGGPVEPAGTLFTDLPGAHRPIGPVERPTRKETRRRRIRRPSWPPSPASAGRPGPLGRPSAARSPPRCPSAAELLARAARRASRPAGRGRRPPGWRSRCAPTRPWRCRPRAARRAPGARPRARPRRRPSDRRPRGRGDARLRRGGRRDRPRTELGRPGGFAGNWKTQKLLDDEVRRIVAEAHDEVVTLLTENRARLDALASALLKHETLDEDDAYAAAGVTPMPGEPGRRARRRRARSTT